MKSLFVSLAGLTVVSNADLPNFRNDAGSGSFPAVDRKREIIGNFYGSMISPLLEGNKDSAGNYLDELLEKVDADKFQFCGFDKNGAPKMFRDENGNQKQCRNKEDFRKMFDSAQNAFKSATYDITDYVAMDDYISVECLFTFKDKTGCTLTMSEQDQFYLDEDDKIAMIRTQQKADPVRECEENASTQPIQRTMSIPKTISRMKEAPKTTRYGQYGGDIKESILKDFIRLGFDCGLKRNKGTMDQKMAEVMNILDENVEMCLIKGMNTENRQCYKGKDAVKDWMDSNFDGKYDNIDYTLSVLESSGDRFKAIVEAEYKEDSECFRSIESDQFEFKGDKIKFIKSQYQLVRNPNGCYPANPEPETTDAQKLKPYAEQRGQRMNEPVIDAEIEDDPLPKIPDLAFYEKPRGNRLMGFDKKNVIEGFYKSAMECSNTDDVDGKVEEFGNYLAETASFCVPETDKMSKKCMTKNEIKMMLRENGGKKDRRSEFAGSEIEIKSMVGNKVEVECKLSYKNPENGCIITRTQNDEFLFDSDGKIESYNNMESQNEFDETTCGNPNE